MKKIILILVVGMLAISCSDDDSNCSGAVSSAASKLTAFNTSPTDENCLALKAALENQRDVCGSLSSALTDTLAGLECDN